jgi:hypothetical protein
MDARSEIAKPLLEYLRARCATALKTSESNIEVALWAIHLFRRDLSLVARCPDVPGLEEPYSVYGGAGHAHLLGLGDKVEVLFLNDALRSTRSNMVNEIRPEKTWIVGIPGARGGVGAQAALYVIFHGDLGVATERGEFQAAGPPGELETGEPAGRLHDLAQAEAAATSAVLEVVRPLIDALRATLDAQWPDFPTPERSGASPSELVRSVARWAMHEKGASERLQFGVGLAVTLIDDKGVHLERYPDIRWLVAARFGVLQRGALFPLNPARPFVEELAEPPAHPKLSEKESPKTMAMQRRLASSTATMPPIFAEWENSVPQVDLFSNDVRGCVWILRFNLASKLSDALTSALDDAARRLFVYKLDEVARTSAAAITQWTDLVGELFGLGLPVEADNFLRFGARVLTSRIAGDERDERAVERMRRAWNSLSALARTKRNGDTANEMLKPGGVGPVDELFRCIAEIRGAIKETKVTPIVVTFWARGVGLCLDKIPGSEKEAISLWPPLPKEDGADGAPHLAGGLVKYSWDVTSRREVSGLSRLLRHLMATTPPNAARRFQVQAVPSGPDRPGGFEVIDVDGGPLHILWRADLWKSLDSNRKPARTAFFRHDGEKCLWVVTSRDDWSLDDKDVSSAEKGQLNVEAWSGHWLMVTRWTTWTKPWPTAVAIASMECLAEQEQRVAKSPSLGPARTDAQWPTRSFAVRLNHVREGWRITDAFARAVAWVLPQAGQSPTGQSEATFLRRLLADLKPHLPSEDEELRRIAVPYLRALVDLCVCPPVGDATIVWAGAPSPGSQSRARCVVFLPVRYSGGVAGLLGLLTSAPRSRRHTDLAFARGTLERQWAESLVHAVSDTYSAETSTPAKAPEALGAGTAPAPSPLPKKAKNQQSEQAPTEGCVAKEVKKLITSPGELTVQYADGTSAQLRPGKDWGVPVLLAGLAKAREQGSCRITVNHPDHTDGHGQKAGSLRDKLRQLGVERLEVEGGVLSVRVYQTAFLVFEVKIDSLVSTWTEAELELKLAPSDTDYWIYKDSGK